MQKGMIVNVYRTEGYNCTRGPSATYDRVLLVGEGVPEIFEAIDDMPILQLVSRRLFGERPHIHAEPLQPSRQNRMFGGNFIYTSDSRFPNEYPIPVHDREEANSYGID